MRNILQKLWLAILLLVIVILTVVWFFQVQLIDHFYIEERRSFVLEQTTDISEMISGWSMEGDTPVDVRSILEILDKNYRIHVSILDTDGNVIIQKTMVDGTLSEADMPELNTDLSARQNDSRVFISAMEKSIFQRITSRSKEVPTISKMQNTPRGELLVATSPIMLDGNYRGMVVAFAPLAPIAETVGVLQDQLAIITLISVIIGSILALLLSRQFTKPILKITNATKEIAGGIYDVKLEVTSKDEIGALAKDIKEMSIQLNEQDRLRKDFIANVSHDLKTPITLIQTYAEFLIEKSLNLDENDIESLEVIRDESIRLDHIVNDLLYLSRIESGALHIELEEVDLNELIDLSERSLLHLLNEKNIKFTVTSTGVPFPIKIDPIKMQRVFINLIHNAIQHAGEIDEININIFYNAPHFRIEVVDKGIGIPEEALARVWERFYKADAARHNSGNSTGIGMSIVKGILQRHNMDFGIDSIVNKGTTIWIEGLE